MLAIIYLLLATHITILSVTLYLHRSQAHRSVTFHPVIAHLMRAWLWLTTGMITREWVAVHRQHHARTDESGDPHSPHVHGIWQVVFKGAWLYTRAAQDRNMIHSLGRGCPDDWIERVLYTPHSRLGIGILLLINVILFGALGVLIWGIQMIWIPLWAAGVVNGIGHWWGYRNGETRDRSRNIFPIGIWIGGEELHNNHHLSPASARLSLKPWEFDIGWLWIRLLCSLRLAELHRA